MLTALAHHETVFSAHAEVVLTDFLDAAGDAGILRARGGSSLGIKGSEAGTAYSPRTRR